MMKGDEKKTIRRFLFDIILTLPMVAAREQSCGLPLIQTQCAQTNFGYFISDIS